MAIFHDSGGLMSVLSKRSRGITHKPATTVLLSGAWCGLLAGLLEGAAYWRFPLLRNPDLPWIAVLLDLAIFLLLACPFVLLSRFMARRPLLTAAHLAFFLLMFYDCATVGVASHSQRVMLRVVSLGVAAALTWTVWKFTARWETLQLRSLAWLALFALLYTGVPPVRRALSERRELAQVSSNAGSPNVILIIVDTLRADHLATYGYQRATSPNISELARRGVLFENAIAPSSWTIPSHASILTARLPYQHGADRAGTRLDGRFPTLSEAFRAHGYRTAAFSANWWNFARRLGFGRGFMHFEDFDSLTSAIVQTNMGERLQNLLLKLRILHASIGHPRAHDINGDILAWIARSHGPFFITANYMDVHEPYLPPLDCFHRFSKLAQPPGDMFFGLPRPSYLTPARVGSEVDAYDAGIYCLDRQMAALQKELDKRGLLRSTILVFTSDHGEGFDEHHLMSHGNSLYRELIHVPLIIAGPGIPAGGTVQQPVSLTWLPATLLTLATGEAGPFPGVAMSRTWDSAQQRFWPYPVSQVRTLHLDPQAPNYSRDLQSIVTPEWHLILGSESGPELYQFNTDLREADNLTDTRPAVANMLKQELRQEETPLADRTPGVSASTSQKSNTTPSSAAAEANRTKANRDRESQKANDYLKALGYVPK